MSTRLFPRLAALAVLAFVTTGAMCGNDATPAGPAADGTATLTVDKPGDAAPATGTTPAPPAAGRNVNGTLVPGDATLNTGEFSDTYTLDVQAGQMVVVDMMSGAFDPYLILRAPSGSQVDNDDYMSDRTRSHIEHVATESGTYSALATSFATGEQGAYTLSMNVNAAGAATPAPTPAPAGAAPAAGSAGGK